LGGGGDSTLDPGGEGRDPTEEFAEPDPAELAALAADLSGVSERILAVAGDLDEKARNLAALVENLVNNRAEFLVVSGRVGRIARDSRRAGEAVGLLSENLLFLATGVEPVGSSDQASEDGTAESEASGPDRAERLSLVGVKAALNRVNGELGALIDEQLFVVPISGSFAFEIDGFTELAGASAELSSATERFESATPGVVAGRE
jgi:hypothetical protein